MLFCTFMLFILLCSLDDINKNRRVIAVFKEFHTFHEMILSSKLILNLSRNPDNYIKISENC